MRILGKILVLVLSLWALFLGICSILGIQIYFPFIISEENQIPYHRMQSVRVAVFMTFIYYSFIYLMNATKEVYPIHFLKVFMMCFGCSSLVFVYKVNASFSEYLISLFFFLCGAIFHIISKPDIKKYFS